MVTRNPLHRPVPRDRAARYRSGTAPISILEGSSYQQENGAKRDQREPGPARRQGEAGGGLPRLQVLSATVAARDRLPLSRPRQMGGPARTTSPVTISSAPSAKNSMLVSPDRSRRWWRLGGAVGGETTGCGRRPFSVGYRRLHGSKSTS